MDQYHRCIWPITLDFDAVRFFFCPSEPFKFDGHIYLSSANDLNNPLAQPLKLKIKPRLLPVGLIFLLYAVFLFFSYFLPPFVCNLFSMAFKSLLLGSIVSLSLINAFANQDFHCQSTVELILSFFLLIMVKNIPSPILLGTKLNLLAFRTCNGTLPALVDISNVFYHFEN